MDLGDRRRALRLFFLGLAAPLALGPSLARAAGSRRPVPQGRFLLRRELERGLAGGASLTVVREWRFGFAPAASGLHVDGEQVRCAVVAPEVLRPLAAIEQARVAPGPFPAVLDTHGRIAESARGAASDKAEAVRIALRMLEDAGAHPTRLREARSYLGSLAKAAGSIISATPPDLFFPEPGSASETRKLALPDGGYGSIAVELAASAGRNGLLERLERRITARIGGDERLSRETWSLLAD